MRPCGRALRVAGRLQLLLDGGGEPVVAADRGDQAAGQQLAEGGVGVGVLGEGRQMRLVGQLTAERDGEAQRLLGGVAQPRREQRGGRGGLAEGRQGHLGLLAGLGVGVVGRSTGIGGGAGVGAGRPLLGEEAVAVVEGARCTPHPVTLPQQGGGLDEAQRQPLGLEPEVGGPGLLVVGQRPVHGALQQPGAAGPAETAEEDLFEVRAGAGGRDVGSGGDQEGAFGGGVEQFVERGAAEFQVVQDDDGADLGDHAQQFGPVGAVLRGPVHGGEQRVQQVGGGAVVAGEPDDAVGGEVGAGGGDGVQQPGAARAGGAGDAYRAAAGEQPDQAFGVLGALFEHALVTGGPGQARGHRGRGGAGGRGALLRVEPAGGLGALPGRAGFYFAAVDGVDGDEVGARDEPGDAGGPAGAAARAAERGAGGSAGLPCSPNSSGPRWLFGSMLQAPRSGVPTALPAVRTPPAPAGRPQPSRLVRCRRG